MENGSQNKGVIEERIESCREIEQNLAIPEFNKWADKIDLFPSNQSPLSKIHFMTETLNLYNKVHQNKFHLHDNKIVKFWFTGSSGEVDFASVDINEFLEQNEYNFNYTYFMHFLLSIFTLGLHRRIIPWLMKRNEIRNTKQITKFKHKIKSWIPEKSYK